jgi:adenylate cyclase
MALHGHESARFEALLRRRGIDPAGDARIEREILERYQDECGVLVLDSSGFTRITQQRGIIHFLALVVAQRDLFRPIFEERDAIAHWFEADNAYGVFPTAKAAVQAALEIQRRRWEENERCPAESRLWVAIGLGYGKLLRIGSEDVYGDQMNLASRLGEDVAEAEEVLATDAVVAQIRDQVSGLDLEPRTTRTSGVEIAYHRLRTAGPLTWR